MIKCPFCGSEYVDVTHNEELVRSYYYCAECGAEWTRAGINRKGPNTPKRKNPLIIPIICIIFAIIVLIAPFMTSEESSVTDFSVADEADEMETSTKASVVESTQNDSVQNDSSDASDNQAADASVSNALANEADDSTDSLDNLSDIEEEKEGTLEITMLNVGQGLSILINADGEYMLYDGGGRESSSYVVAYLKSHGITELKYLVASHYDEDHIAGLVGVLNKYDVELALTPDYETDTAIYESFKNKIEEKDVEEYHPDRGETYELGASEFEILGPDNYSSSDDNNNSIVIQGRLNDFSYLLTGDAEEIEEFNLMNHSYDLESTLYVVGHHGSLSSSGYDFLHQVSPECVMISAGLENSYGHPAEATMERLKDLDVKMYRSDLQEEVTLTTDGHEWSVDKKTCKDWSDGYTLSEKLSLIPVVADKKESKETKKSSSEKSKAPSEESQTIEEPAEVTYDYVLNTNTRKFHYPECKSVKQMKDKNKAYREGVTRESVINEGYDPCGNCHP